MAHAYATSGIDSYLQERARIRSSQAQMAAAQEAPNSIQRAPASHGYSSQSTLSSALDNMPDSDPTRNALGRSEVVPPRRDEQRSYCTQTLINTLGIIGNLFTTNLAIKIFINVITKQYNNPNYIGEDLGHG
ncbi:MAG: hypothetical protein KGJ02_01900 [Verrucomicrobiota bacterium]|nr:hypothetical protein [Verrucomicrobiota bacterium]